MNKKVKLSVTKTGEILGVFNSLAEADEFHDVWISKHYPDDNHCGYPECTFEYID